MLLLINGPPIPKVAIKFSIVFFMRSLFEIFNRQISPKISKLFLKKSSVILSDLINSAAFKDDKSTLSLAKNSIIKSILFASSCT